MHARIARFEGAEGNWDDRIEEIKDRMREGMGRGEAPIKRSLMLVDRESGTGASLIFCDSEDDLRQADQFMNQMSPPSGTGRRSSVELYEVAIDSDELR
jgi:hypothetical protein